MTLKAENAALQGEIEILTAQVTALQEQVAALTATLHAAQARIKEKVPVVGAQRLPAPLCLGLRADSLARGTHSSVRVRFSALAGPSRAMYKSRLKTPPEGARRHQASQWRLPAPGGAAVVPARAGGALVGSGPLQGRA
jgi:hypothetical protein